MVKKKKKVGFLKRKIKFKQIVRPSKQMTIVIKEQEQEPYVSRFFKEEEIKNQNFLFK